jgi:hypothetical protein
MLLKTHRTAEGAFLGCSCCDRVWPTRDAFLDDPLLDVVGYQADFLRLGAGYFLITHLARGCGSTLALEVERFADLYLGPRYGPDLRGTAACTGLCGRTEVLVRCRNRCRNAWVRELLRAIVERRRTRH